MSIYVVGIGPGDKKMMTEEAVWAIGQCEVIAGYDTYIDLIKDMLGGKKVISTGMRKETDRVAAALKEARQGKNVAVISSGDAGIYGMAGLVYEMAENSPDIEIIIVAGVTAASSAAAVLGAPLMNDFAVISLSDQLTPWPLIEKRLAAAAQGDFAVAIYNPSSATRHDYLQKACAIMLNYKDAHTPCGLVRNIGREGCAYELCTLSEMAQKNVDMFTTVIIGNSATRIINNKLVTLRGYTYGQ